MDDFVGKAGMSGGQSNDTTWTKINVSAAVLASLVALGGLGYTVYRGQTGSTSASDSANRASGSSAPTRPDSDPSSASSPSTASSLATDSLHLSSLRPSAGAGNVTAAGDALTIGCGTNQSDDTFREVQYAIPTTLNYQHVQATVRGGGGGADQQYGLTVYARGRYVRADQSPAIASAVLRPAGQGTLSGALPAQADTLVLRLVCHLPEGAVTIDGAALTR